MNFDLNSLINVRIFEKGYPNVSNRIVRTGQKILVKHVIDAFLTSSLSMKQELYKKLFKKIL